MSSGSGPKPLFLKPRGAAAPIPWQEIAVDSEDVTPTTPLEEADYVCLDIETTGNRPFLVLEIGAERFRMDRSLAFFDTLVDCRAPINPYARRRHQIDRSMLVGAPEFGDVRKAFLHFARGAVLVEHSHDAFDTWLVGRGLNRPLEHPIIDTTAMARLILDLPPGQTPGLSRLVEELEVEIQPEHAALGDARATAAVFRRLIERGREQLGWRTVGDVLVALPRREVDRSRLEGPASPKRAVGTPAAGPARPAPTSGSPTEASPGRTRRRRSSARRRRPDAPPAPAPNDSSSST